MPNLLVRITAKFFVPQLPKGVTPLLAKYSFTYKHKQNRIIDVKINVF